MNADRPVYPVYEKPRVSGAGSTVRPSGLWEGIPEARILNWQWLGNGHRLDVRTRLCLSGSRLWVRFDCLGEEPVVNHRGHQQPVYEDSCLEFFFEPRPGKGYFNFEVNAGGWMLAAFGPIRSERRPLPVVLIEDMGITTDIRTAEQGWPEPPGWSVEYSIPVEAIERWSGVKVSAGLVAAGNFYKCGDRTLKPHYGSWSMVDSPTPDFHRPESFGRLEFQPAPAGY